MKVKAAVVNEVNSPYVIEEINLTEMRDNEVLVKIVASGICHSDDANRLGHVKSTYPAVLGHEGSGIVEQVGKNVKNFKPGDHVAMSYAYCAHCDNCHVGDPVSCDSWGKLNTQGKREDGTYIVQKDDGRGCCSIFGQASFSTYSLVAESNLIKVDPEVDLRLVGPLGCGFLTGSGTVFNSLHPEPGSSIAIFGTGSVGFAAMMAAKICGCSQIIGIDIINSRLEIAKELGATHTINSKEADVRAEIKAITNKKGVNYIVDTTGIPAVIKQAVQLLATRGVIAPVAASPKDVEINMYVDLTARNRTIKGVLMGQAVPQIAVRQLIEYYKAGKFPFDKLVKFYKFDNINQASEDSLSGKTIKPILIIDEDYVPRK